MSAHPPLTQQGDGSLSPPPTLHAPPSDVRLEGAHNVHSYDPPVSSSLEIDHSIATDLGTHVNLASQLWLSLPANCRRLRQQDLKVVGTRPIDAGSFADIWVGMMGDRKVAVKSYRYYSSTDCTTYTEVSHI